jgi:hypothetical protein
MIYFIRKEVLDLMKIFIKKHCNERISSTEKLEKILKEVNNIK